MVSVPSVWPEKASKLSLWASTNLIHTQRCVYRCTHTHICVWIHKHTHTDMCMDTHTHPPRMSKQSSSSLRDDPTPPTSSVQLLEEAAGGWDPESSASPSPYPRHRDRTELLWKGETQALLLPQLPEDCLPCQQLERGRGRGISWQTDRQTTPF